MNSKEKIKILFLVLGVMIIMFACGPLNPINDFFGIQMNPTEEANFIIVDYNDIDGVTYKNSINMNPKINAWVEISTNEITLKVINNSDETIPLNYIGDQFIIITDEQEYMMGKGERAEYFKKGMIAPGGSEIFNLELPQNFGSISTNDGGYVEQTQVTKNVMRNFSKTEGKLNIMKDNIQYIIAKFGKISIVLKKVPVNK